jgi:hypothetical protein
MMPGADRCDFLGAQADLLQEVREAGLSDHAVMTLRLGLSMDSGK